MDLIFFFFKKIIAKSLIFFISQLIMVDKVIKI